MQKNCTYINARDQMKHTPDFLKGKAIAADFPAV